MPVGKRFSSTYQPENRGRKKSKLKGLIEDIELSSEDVSMLIKNIFDKNEAELEALANDKEKPIIMRAFVAAVVDDVEQGKLTNIAMLLDRAIGRIKEEKPNITTLDEAFEKDKSVLAGLLYTDE